MRESTSSKRRSAAAVGTTFRAAAAIRLSRIVPGSQIGSFTQIKATDGDLHIGENVHVGTCCFISADAGGVNG